MIDLWWLDISLCPFTEAVSPTYLNEGKGLTNISQALLSFLNPTAFPIRSLWGLLASASVCLLTGHLQHVHLSPFCQFMRCLSLRCPLECQEEQEVCVSVLSGEQVVGAPMGNLQAGPVRASSFQE